MRKPAIIIVALLLLLTGCATIPFEQPQLTDIGDISGVEYVKQFQAHIPASADLLTTVVFNGWGKTFSSLGLIKYDQSDGSFLIAGLTQMGIKIFELAGDREQLTRSYTMPQIPKPKRFTRALADDIRHIYFDWLPPADAKPAKNKNTVVFTALHNSGKIEYTYGGAQPTLLTKRCYNRNDRLLWKATYYEYQTHGEDGMLYPRGIVLNNYQYGYRLTVTLTDVRS